MKIISKFEDYYDSLQYDYGENVFYDRNMNLRVIEKEKYCSGFLTKNSPLVDKCLEIFKTYIQNYDYHYYLSVCIVGEKIVPFITIFDKNTFYESTKFRFIYQKEDIESIKDEFKDSYSFLMNSSKKKLEARVAEHFERDFSNLYNKIREICKEPIILYSGYRERNSNYSINSMNTTVVLNPRLKEIGFSKIMSAQNVIQEIELFLNKINNKENDIEFSDDLKIINAGFDKNSFRKRKGKENEISLSN